MKTNTVAGRIAKYVVYRLKNTVIQIREMEVVEQEDIRNTVRNAAFCVLNESSRQSAKDYIEAALASFTCSLPSGGYEMSDSRSRQLTPDV